jgi:hypothetical protein
MAKELLDAIFTVQDLTICQFGELSDVQGFQLFGEEKGVCISQEN